MKSGVFADYKIFAGMRTRSSPKRSPASWPNAGKSTVSKFSDGEAPSASGRQSADWTPTSFSRRAIRQRQPHGTLHHDRCDEARSPAHQCGHPYYGYARQDRKAKARDRSRQARRRHHQRRRSDVVTMDLHAAQIQGTSTFCRPPEGNAHPR